MAGGSYSVIPVGTLPSTVETKGSRRKFWVMGQDGRTEWLLKFPRTGTGEHWAEKVVAEIGNMIGVNCARIELARCRGELGTICQSFIQTDDDEEDFDSFLPSPIGGFHVQYLHGSEILGAAIDQYDVDLRFNQRGHNVKDVVAAIMDTSHVQSPNPYALWDLLLENLAAYLVLDGLVGNTDRHHDNWMVVYVHDVGNPKIFAAPSFDHASSLGRELTDTRREKIIESNWVLHYLYRGQGGVFVDNRRRRALAPLQLARLLCRWQPEFTRRTLENIAAVPNSAFHSVIDRVPAGFMSETAKELAYQIVVTSKAELLRSPR